MKGCSDCRDLELALAQAIAERDEARHQAARATDLLMKEEALRQQTMLQSILSMDEKKARAVYLATGKQL